MNQNRIRWRSRRGSLELDMILKSFLDERFASLTPADQQAFEKLLSYPDDTLMAYVEGRLEPPEQELRQLVSKIRN